MSWYSVSLTGQQIANGVAMRLQDKFIDLFTLAAAPRGAAMLDSRDIWNRVYYFSPEAVRIASLLILEFGGVECAPPAREDLHLLVGDQRLDGVPFANRSE